MPSGRKAWSREELILAINLYCRIPFGRQHSHAPEVIELAKALGRTPSSVAMKLNNLTSLDPEERMRGVKGLSAASKLDRAVWAEFESDWEEMAAFSEQLWGDRLGVPPEKEPTQELAEVWPEGKTVESVSFGPVKRRLAQAFFRRTVLSAYGQRCCITGLALPSLLEAAHIVPLSESAHDGANPRNGLCLNLLHHRAFDLGLITVDESGRLLVSSRVSEIDHGPFARQSFKALHGKLLLPPDRFPPEARFLEWHREVRFGIHKESH